MKSLFLFSGQPWLFTFLFMLCWVICFILITICLRLILRLENNAQIPSPWVPLLAHILTIFIVVPFVLGFPGKSHSYTDFLSGIRLTKVQPLLGLILLGLSCYLILESENPLEDINTIREPLGVMAAGRWFSGKELPQLIEIPRH